jgi:hypothetical protein
MESGTNLDDYFRAFHKEHQDEIKKEATAPVPKPPFKWVNQLWGGVKDGKSPNAINKLQSKWGRRFIFSDREKIMWDIKKFEWERDEHTTQVEVLIDEWALHYYTSKRARVTVTPTEEMPQGYYWAPEGDSAEYKGTWPLCILKTVTNPKTKDEEFFWETGTIPKGGIRYIRLEEKYFNQLRHEIYFRGLRIPAFHSRYGGLITFHGDKDVAVRYIEEYMEDENYATLERLITFNKMLKEIQIESQPKKGPIEARMAFRELYMEYIDAKQKIEGLKKQIARMAKVLPPKGMESETAEEGEELPAE